MALSRTELMNCAAWKKAPPGAEVYVKKRNGIIYPVMYLKWDRDGVDFVAEDSKVHLLPLATVRAFKMTPITKRIVEKEFAEQGGNSYVWADRHDSDKERVRLVGRMIIIEEY